MTSLALWWYIILLAGCGAFAFRRDSKHQTKEKAAGKELVKAKLNAEAESEQEAEKGGLTDWHKIIRELLEKGTHYQDAGLSRSALAYFSAEVDRQTWWGSMADWANVLVGHMEELPSGVETDDHDGTPIGEGDTIGLVGAEVQMDEAQLALLPSAFRSGLFSSCQGPCARWPAAVRVSHTKALSDLTRISLKMDTTSNGIVDLHFTETIKHFPMRDVGDLKAFIYSERYGKFAATLRHPGRMAFMALKSRADEKELKKYRVVSKDFYSMTPFMIGTAGQKTAGAMKFRLRPLERLTPDAGDHSKAADFKPLMRRQFCRDVTLKDREFEIQIQVATDPKKNPINDAAYEWDEGTAPWVTMGRLRIPKQSFSGDIEQLTAGSAIGEALWGEGALANSKELLFAPGSNPHRPLGDINAFREYAYPIYDRARQAHLLGKPGGAAGKCPFANIARFVR